MSVSTLQHNYFLAKIIFLTFKIFQIMTTTDCFKRLVRMDYHIRHKSTGKPSDFWQFLEISETTLYRNLLDLKNMGAVIVYDKDLMSFVYEEPFEFSF
jgi:hypothetical protein